MQNISDRIEVNVSYKVFANTLAVVQEGAKAAAVQVIQDCYEKMLVELKGCWELQKEQKSQMIKAYIAKISHIIMILD